MQRRIMLFILPLMMVASTEAQVSPYKLQSLYMYSFIKYIKWTNNTPSFVISIYGESNISQELSNTINGTSVNNKKIEVRTISSIEDGEGSHIIYVTKNRSYQLEKLLQTYEGKGVLIVTEEDLADQGAPVSFFVADTKLKFKINQKSFAKTRLDASHGLLNLAVLQ